MSEPLFTVTAGDHPGLHGPIRVALDSRIRQLEGRDWEPDLVLLVQNLADRVDQMNLPPARQRGYVQLAAEYRAARIDLFGADDDGGAESLENALAAFAAAETGNAPGPKR